jgi:hypothetical protein
MIMTAQSRKTSYIYLVVQTIIGNRLLPGFFKKFFRPRDTRKQNRLTTKEKSDNGHAILFKQLRNPISIKSFLLFICNCALQGDK